MKVCFHHLLGVVGINVNMFVRPVPLPPLFSLFFFFANISLNHREMNFVSAEHQQYMRSSTAIDVLFVVDRGYRLRHIIDSKVQSPKWSQTGGGLAFT